MRRVALAALIGLGAVVVALPANATAANRRIAIGHYQWSDRDFNVDLGEHVTWYWVGPDLQHSVTETSPVPGAVDTDAGSNIPHHDLGDHFELSFNQPGTFAFHCKLHPSVGGTVTVSSVPGDPNSEPDPVPRSNVDVRAPHIDPLTLGHPSMHRHGTILTYGLDEAASLDAEIYRVRTPRIARHLDFAGYQVWKGGRVGYNRVRFAAPSKHFRPKPGAYVAFARATDASNNESARRKLEFTIR